jgi:hypothetical protein
MSSAAPRSAVDLESARSDYDALVALPTGAAGH